MEITDYPKDTMNDVDVTAMDDAVAVLSQLVSNARRIDSERVASYSERMWTSEAIKRQVRVLYFLTHNESK